MIFGISLWHAGVLLALVLLFLWFIGPRIVSRLAHAYFRQREDSIKRVLKIAKEGD